MVNKIVYMRPQDAEVFDRERFVASLQKYGAVNLDLLDKELDKLHYDPLHVSVLVEVGVKVLENDEAARKYWDDHQNYIGQNFERLRRITGYLVGSLERWNDGKQAEERDRVKHGVYSQENKDYLEAEKFANSVAAQI